MLILCDQRATADVVLPPHAPPLAPLDTDALAPAVGAIWQGLGGGPRSWACPVPPDSVPGPSWPLLAIRTHAPASQLDLLHGPLAGHVHAAGPVACLALDGDGFHGHHGRTWAAVPGNLHLSVALPTRWPAATAGASLSMLPAVAVCDAIADASGGRVQPAIKWVNDILTAGGKVAGVLTRTRVMGDAIDLVAFGIGVNLAVAPLVTPTPFVPATACLRRCPGGDTLTLGTLACAVLAALASRLDEWHRDGPVALHRAYCDRSVVIGRHVGVWDDRATDGVASERWPAPIATGVVTAIGQDLSLSIAGHRAPVDHGRLVLAEHLPTATPSGAR